MTLVRALESCVLADLTPLARIRSTGRDILDLLHRLSTQDLKGLPVGAGAPTVLTSSKGRIVERLFVYRIAEREVLLLAGAGHADAVLAHIRRFTFAEDAGLTDATAETGLLALVGPEAAAVLARGGLPDPGPHGAVRTRFAGAAVVVLGGDGFGAEGRSVVMEADDVSTVRKSLTPLAVEADSGTIETWRILRGFPRSGAELTEDWNPLEAGLRDHVSFTKGCYVGQEVVARLNTYDKVSRRLVVLRFASGSRQPEPGAEVLAGDSVVGRVTSATTLPDGSCAALALLKAHHEVGETVVVGEASGSIVTP